MKHITKNIVFCCLALSGGLSAATLKLPKALLEYRIGSNWRLTGRELSRFHAIYTFKRKVIVDSKGRRIIPAVGIGVRSYDEPIDPIRYSVFARKAFHIPEFVGMYSWHDGKFSIKSGVMIIGRTIDRFTRLPHTVIMFTAVYDRYTLSSFANVPTELYPQVEKDFLAFYRSLRLRTGLRIPEIIEQREKNHIAIKAKDWPYGLVKRMLKKNHKN